MKIKITFFSLVLLCCLSVFAQKSDHSTPKSIELKLNDDWSLKSSKRTFPALDLNVLKVEDENDEKNGLPPRFGYPINANLNLTNSGIWKVLANGDRIWRLEIECVNAISINLLYDKFWLPNGAKLHLYSKNKSQVIGGFNSTNNRGTRQNPSKFTTGLIFSQSIILELFEPVTVKNQSILSVDKVVHGYREIDLKDMMTSEAGHGDSGPCQVNVNCSEGQNWQNEKKGVAMILVNGTRWCSGSLVNNTSNDQTPYFLTADHCIGSLDANGDTDASFYSFWWNYESSTCNQNSSDFVAESTSGATLVANNSASDFALFQLTESPLDSNIDVYFNGWDRTTSPTQGGVGIHHPSGDFKKIATHNVTPSPGQVWGSNTHWRVNWSQTTNGFSVTEGGSSGSPLFTNNKRIIGQLHGGSSINCSDPANDPGEYGRFHVSWNGSSPQRRLRDWLDPINQNPNYLDGIGSAPQVSIDDIDLLCFTNPIIINLTGNQNSVTWQVSSNTTVLSSNNNSISVRASSSNSNGSGWVKATLSNGTVLQDDFWVGTPQLDINHIQFFNVNTPTGFSLCSFHTGNKFKFNANGFDQVFRYQFKIKQWNSSSYLYTSAIKSSIGSHVEDNMPHFSPNWYVFELRLKNSCGWSDWFTYFVQFTDCNNFENTHLFKTYPNPTSNILTIENMRVTNALHTTKGINESINRVAVADNNTFSLHNFSGNMMLSGKLKNITTIDVSQLKKGNYILKIHVNGNIEIHQIIIK